jgi:hypothetical protein
MSKARLSPHVLKSLQTCSIRENGDVLQEIGQSLKSKPEIDKINGLLAVLQQLVVTKISENGKEVPNCFLKFEEGHDLFMGFDTDYVPGTQVANIKYDKQRFQHALLYPIR